MWGIKKLLVRLGLAIAVFFLLVMTSNPVSAGITLDDERSFRKIFTYDDSAGTYSADLSGSSAWDYFTDDCTENDAIYLGNSYFEDWQDIKFYVGTAFSANSVTFVWEYYSTSKVWTTLTVNDGTNNFSFTGERWVCFDSPLDSKETTVNGIGGHWIRVRIAAVDTPTEGGAQSTQVVKCRNRTILVDNYASGSPANFDSIKTADDAGTLVLMPPMPCTANMVPAHRVRPVEYGAIKIDCNCSPFRQTRTL